MKYAILLCLLLSACSGEVRSTRKCYIQRERGYCKRGYDLEGSVVMRDDLQAEVCCVYD